MKKIFVVLVISFLTLVTFSKTLTIYTYESLNWIEDGVIQIFEEMYNCNVNVVKLGGAGNVLNRLRLEKIRPRADIVIGLDQSLTLFAVQNDLLIPYKPENINLLKNEDLVFDKNYYVTPFSYGGIAVVYDPNRIDQIPKNFEDLTKNKSSLIIQNPRSSSTGQSFLLWTIAVYGDEWQDYWRRLKPAILTVTSGWSDSYSRFEAGEAPMMVSYATDGAYSYYYYQSTRYKSFIPEDGSYVQIEGAGVVKGTQNEELAKQFIEFILTDDFQKEIPLNQWMFPVTNVKLPDAFKYAIIPDKILSLDTEELENNLENWLNQWERIMY